MSNKIIPCSQIDRELLEGRRWIDVRAPLEFAQGHIPGAVNLPLLNDDERARVGTTYKQQGQDAAVRLGHELVSGDARAARLSSWCEARERDDAYVYCFRGGLRSQIVRQWLQDAGRSTPLLEGGYKAARQHFLEIIETIGGTLPYIVITGPSGSGKTDLLTSLRSQRPVLDLEGLARHRGSAFGAREIPQPAQAQFENDLALELLRIRSKDDPRPVVVEDESWMIGKCQVPSPIYQRMADSRLIAIEESLETRTERVFQDYVAPQASAKTFASLRRSIQTISKKLGGVRTQELLVDLDCAVKSWEQTGQLGAHRDWIRKLLNWYYDPFYRRRLENSSDKIVYRGSLEDCRKFLS